MTKRPLFLLISPGFLLLTWGTWAWMLSVLVSLLIVAVLVLWDSKFIRIWRRDLSLVRLCCGASLDLAVRSWQGRSLSEIFEDVRGRAPGKTCFVYEDRDWSFQGVENYANQVANFFLLKLALRPGDCVALFATSSPEYVCIWLGLAKIGCTTALINSNIKDTALVHAIQLVKAKAVIVSCDLLEAYRQIAPEVTSKSVASFILEERAGKFEKLHEGEKNGFLPGNGKNGPVLELVSLDRELRKMSTEKPDCVVKLRFTDKLGYIFTSGTTGLPKACVITTTRMFAFAVVVRAAARLTTRDVIYCALPLYHIAGGMIAVGQAILFGSTVVIRKKFSATSFWTDIAHHQCTAFQYIGEMCRYLLQRPASPLDGQTKCLRIMIGQGLRGNIWQEFVERFKIPFVLETYGCTEGNVGMANLNWKMGAIGITSAFIRLFRPQYLILVDPATGMPRRTEKGLCIPAKAGEVGELVGRIYSWNPYTHFDGYLDKDASEKKILTNVLRPGDKFFRTGDLMTEDDEGFVSFVDRSGDTFRWKGENVSSTEVENAIANCLPDCDVAVFGVHIPGLEGRAGMACLAPSTGSGLDAASLRHLSDCLKMSLPSYARPVFLRIVPYVHVTGTFKLNKVRMKEDAYNVSVRPSEPVFYLERQSDTYKLVTPDIYWQIQAGSLRW